MEGTDALSTAITALQSQLSVSAFTDVLANYLPIVGAAVLVGFAFYCLRWVIGLFRGI